ncbi:formamidopyrimidine-DNA glycosylase isoform X2 [Cucurbita pepo subsp. pepo]|uniref:formamidopyrimidine-DNA glycosylase isoform X2 n=1 Tax=Cucurbita pepo subsp. pepo TaxID=3664 RepID=UPI000C9D4A8B|nr:formamidopyrimidine-DNA glycosylase isoform X2 [Cucurbita pepo subsp. pepo]
MPELPEVEAARRAIEEHCVGKVIKKALIADDSKVIDGISPSDFEASLLGKTILSAHRKGKHMWLRLDSPPFPTFHFGMAGAIYIKGVAVTNYKRSVVNEDDEWPSKYSKFFVELDDGVDLSFTDKRRFAKVCLLKDPASVPPISKLGPDALLEPMALDDFIESLGKKKLAIKTLLLDQSYISGIGNWIADEVLYQARIHPNQSAATLSKESCAALHKSIQEVLKRAVDVDAESNNFPEEWLFHFRWGKKPGKVNGKEIHFITTGGRTSAFVPELQKLTGAEPKNQNSKRKINEGKKMNDEGVGELVSKTKKTADTTDTKTKSKPKGPSKKPSTKRKSKINEDDGSDEEAENDDASDDEDNIHDIGKMKAGKRTNVGRMHDASESEKPSKQTVPSSRSGKQRKKAK